ncbi:MAG: maleylacetate reductase [Acidimicrobiales bacterium]
MRDFTYDALGGRVVFGVGARRRIPEEVDALGASSVVVVASSRDDATVEGIVAGLGDGFAGRFSDVAQHVPVQKVSALREIVTEARADLVVTVGGGSAIGFGKAVALDPGVMQVAVPTTYSGSEMTPIWGMTADGHKKTGRDPRVQPDVVVYDPELTLSLPPGVAGPSGMNALAHCVEALYAPGANPVISLLALEGISALAGALPAVVARPDDVDARTSALYGAYLAGCSLAVAGTALHHRTCHVLGGMFGLNHGDMNAAVLPHALAYTRPAIHDEYGRMSDVLGGDAAGALFDLARAIGAPVSLAEIGMPPDGVGPAAERIVGEAAANPRPPTVDGIMMMLDDALSGKAPGAGSLRGRTRAHE